MLKLGHYLGPSKGISTAMTPNIFTEDGQLLDRSTYTLLTPNDLWDEDGPDAQKQFMARVCERLGSQVLPRESEDIGIENTLLYDLHEEETQNKQTFPLLAKEIEPMPEVGDHYIGAEILLPTGDDVAKGRVVGWSC